MVPPNLVAALLVLLPAMGILFWVLRRFEGYFESNRLFFALTVGMVTGVGIRFLEVFLFQFESGSAVAATGWVASLAYTVVGYAMLEALANQAVLGFKKFRARKDTAYYGASLGVGFGGMWGLQVVQAAIQIPTATPIAMLGGFAVSRLAEGLLLGVGLVLAHTAAAVWVGQGSGEGKLWRGAMIGTLWLLPALALYWGEIRIGGLLFGAGLAAYGLLAVWYANKALDNIVPPEIQEMVRKERRRALRKGDA